MFGFENKKDTAQEKIAQVKTLAWVKKLRCETVLFQYNKLSREVNREKEHHDSSFPRPCDGHYLPPCSWFLGLFVPKRTLATKRMTEIKKEMAELENEYNEYRACLEEQSSTPHEASSKP